MLNSINVKLFFRPPPAEEFELENLSSHSTGPPPLMSLTVPVPQDDRDYDQRSSYLPKALEDALALNVERANQVNIEIESQIILNDQR